VLEDLHWADQLTLEVVGHLAARLAEEVRLPRLTMAQTAAMTGAVLGRAASASVVAAIHDGSDGIPLHAEELLAAIRPDLGGIASLRRPVPTG
jgi:predicted ATPase